MTIRFLLAGLLVVAAILFTACSPKHIDPPVYVHQYSAIEAMLHARDLPGGKGVLYSISGASHSMAPFLQANDLIVVDRGVPFDKLEVGQIVTYHAVGPNWPGRTMADMPVTHRIVVIDKDGLVLSGDDNAHTEAQSRVTKETYIGLVVAVYRVLPTPAAK